MIIGIDPGAKGAIVGLHNGHPHGIYDMPSWSKGVNAAGIAEILRNLTDPNDPHLTTVVIEDVHSMPKQGVASAFTFGVAKGVLLGVVAALGATMIPVSPSTWKRQMGLTSDKDLCRRRASELWPGQQDRFSRKRDDGRAEAALMARWYYDKFERTN